VAKTIAHLVKLERQQLADMPALGAVTQSRLTCRVENPEPAWERGSRTPETAKAPQRWRSTAASRCCATPIAIGIATPYSPDDESTRWATLAFPDQVTLEPLPEAA
jgi:hypothetical protein